MKFISTHKSYSRSVHILIIAKNYIVVLIQIPTSMKSYSKLKSIHFDNQWMQFLIGYGYENMISTKFSPFNTLQSFQRSVNFGKTPTLALHVKVYARYCVKVLRFLPYALTQSDQQYSRICGTMVFGVVQHTSKTCSVWYV